MNLRKVNPNREYDNKSGLLVFDKKTIFFLGFCFFAFVLLVFLKIHGSSIPIWNQLVVDSPSSNGLIAGLPRGTRSDEWVVSTPFTLSQLKHSPVLPLENESLGEGKVPLLMNLPTNHLTSVLRPQLWGYYFLSPERGFAFYWNFKIYGLIVSFFLLLMILTRNNFWLSVLGSGWLLFSSYIQWWLSCAATELIISFCCIFIAGAYILFSKNRNAIILNSVIMIIFLLNFILVLYPPFQIPLVYLLLVLFAGLFFQHYSVEDIKKFLGYRIFVISSVGALTGYILFGFYIDARQTIVYIMNTVYPGKRRSVGGGISIIKYFSGFFNFFMTENKLPKFFNNASEASNFLMLYPVAIVGYSINYFKKRKNNTLEILVAAYIAILSIYMIYGFPEIISKLTLFSFSTSQRGFLALGIANIILCILYLNNKKYVKTNKVEALMIFFIVMAATLLFGLVLREHTALFFRYRQIAMVSLLISTISTFLFYKNSLLFAIFLMPAIIASNILINPISIGLKPIFDKKISNVIADKNQNKATKWAVYGDRLRPNFFIANGANVFDGVKYTPPMGDLKKLDSSGKYANTYN